MIETLFYVISFVGFLSLLGYFYGLYNLSYWRRKNVSEYGNKHFLFGSFQDVFRQKTSAPNLLHKIYTEGKEPFVGFYMLQKPALLIRDADLIRQMFVRDFNVFSNHFFGSSSSDPITSKNLFSLQGSEWKYLRTKLSPIFTSGKLKKLFLLIIESSELMNKYLEKEFESLGRDEKRAVEVRTIANKYSTNNIASLAFGVAINCFETPTPEFFTRGTDLASVKFLRGLRLMCLFFFPSVGKYLGGSFLGEHSDFFRNVFWESMEYREKEKFKRGDLIDFLIELKNEEQDATFKLDRDTLLAQAAIFFIAGKETSNSGISFALQELAKHPECQDKLRREIKEKLAGGLTYESLSDMKYLYQVISETLRLYNPAPIIDRITNEDYQIPNSNVTIEAGTPVYVILNGVHKDPRYHPNPEKFDPERFSDERKSEMVSGTYMPFGDGPRICIGQRLGLLQTAIGIVTILKNYQVSINPKYKNEIDVRSIFVQMKDGLWLDFKKIK